MEGNSRLIRYYPPIKTQLLTLNKHIIYPLPNLSLPAIPKKLLFSFLIFLLNDKFSRFFGMKNPL